MCLRKWCLVKSLPWQSCDKCHMTISNTLVMKLTSKVSMMVCTQHCGIWWTEVASDGDPYLVCSWLKTWVWTWAHTTRIQACISCWLAVRSYTMRHSCAMTLRMTAKWDVGNHALTLCEVLMWHSTLEITSTSSVWIGWGSSTKVSDTVNCWPYTCRRWPMFTLVRTGTLCGIEALICLIILSICRWSLIKQVFCQEKWQN